LLLPVSNSCAGPAHAPHGQVPDLDGLRPDRAKELVAGFLADAPKGGWLSQEQTAQLLGCYGVPLADRIAVSTEDAAAEAAAHFGTPVALKADLPSVIRPIDVGAVLLDLRDAEEVRRGFRSLRESFADRLAAIHVQPMITGGVTVRISVLQEQVFGPLVLFGLRGATLARWPTAPPGSPRSPTPTLTTSSARHPPPRCCSRGPAPPPPTLPR
jgi:acyl-CoA synthetase (NDP forming)